MQTPEEVAREAWQAVADSTRRDDQSAVDAMAEVIAARDAEVRVAERAKVLAGFTEDREACAGIELLETGADVPLSSGGGAYLTSEHFEGLPTGTLVLYVYRMADDGHIETLYYVSKPREDDR